MRWLIIPLLLAAILFFGCLGSSAPPAPPYKAPAKQNTTVTLPAQNTSTTTPPAPPSPPVTPPKNTTKPANQTTTPPAKPPNATSPATNATPPAVNNTTSQPPSSLVCGGSGSTAMLECIVDEAISQKKVSICTQLTSQEDRYKCFTRWCYSPSKDYKQCQALTNTDDRLGCLNKCNPNFNT